MISGWSFPQVFFIFHFNIFFQYFSIILLFSQVHLFHFIFIFLVWFFNYYYCYFGCKNIYFFCYLSFVNNKRKTFSFLFFFLSCSTNLAKFFVTMLGHHIQRMTSAIGRIFAELNNSLSPKLANKHDALFIDELNIDGGKHV